MEKLEIMNKIQKNLGGNTFEVTKKGNFKIKDIFGQVHYYNNKKFNKMFELAKNHNFYGVDINK